MRRLLAAVGLLVASASCENVSKITIVDVRPFRVDDKNVGVDVDVVAAEQSGRTVGPYCVSVHVVPFGFDPNTPGLLRYRGEVGYAEVCADDLHDGDMRTYHLVTTRPPYESKIETNNPIRVQTQFGRTISDNDDRVVP